MKTISLRVDVDTLEGSLRGIPTLLRILDRQHVRASFYFCFGPDNSGKAIRRIFRKGFLEKMIRTKAVGMYGLKTMMYGVLLPAPIIWKSAIAQMRQVRESGHEVAIHGWDHVCYHDYLDFKSKAWLSDWLVKAHEAFTTVFGINAKGSVSPAWRCNDNTLILQETYKLDYAGDCRGYVPFYPIVGGNVLTTLQIPTTLPTMDELLGVDKCGPAQANSHLWDLVRDDALNVYTLHAEAEGGMLSESFEAFLEGLRHREVRTLTHEELAIEWKRGEIPSCVIGRQVIPGRAGWVSFANIGSPDKLS